MKAALIKAKLPERIGRLDELANNLWWSWHTEGRELFRSLDYLLWRTKGHNPVKQLSEISNEKLRAAAADPDFLIMYDSAMKAFDQDMSLKDAWFTHAHRGALSSPIAYFSMEYAIHNSLPIYAGGLGVLAGDLCKEASDLGLPFVAVGFMYPQGYFHQHISSEGWQEEIYRQLDFDEAPVNPLFSSDGRRPLARIQLGNKTLNIGVWEVKVGSIKIYLLDTDVEGNSPQDRQLSAHLYIADRELRVQQEIVLGIGGVRVLRALGIHPEIWHANEGHTTFMMAERIREEVQKGIPFEEAARRVRGKTVFTTHTPVPAGNDIFPLQLVEHYLHGYWESIGVDCQHFWEFGQDGSMDHTFNMTVLGLRLSEHSNAVSKLHGEVARSLWHALWPREPVNKVPITHITNGVHVPTWIAPEMDTLFKKYIAEDWVNKQDDPGIWERIRQIPDEELWTTHQIMKRRLISTIHERAQERWAEGGVTPQQVLAIGALLDPAVLTIGFVRRFTEYKRPALIFQDIERFKRLVNDPLRPIQIVFAGKSHPADFLSKNMLHQVYLLAMQHDFQGRIAFVEDYDMHIARSLVQGMDVWLNNPRRMQEACGTSGMKASINGVPHFSVCDGWWYEGYNGENGWAIGAETENLDPGTQDRLDALSIYDLLEKQIMPLYYERDRSGVPHGWARIVKEAICTVMPVFCATRMVKEYTEKVYLPATLSK